MNIVNCRVNHIVEPVGYPMKKTVFSWKVEQAQGKNQKTARLCVSEAPSMISLLYDSGKQEHADSLGWEVPLCTKPCTEYFWTVEVESDAGERAISQVNRFETGKEDQTWSGRWITCDSTAPRHPRFEKTWEVGGAVKKARLYICGLGLYTACLNGEKIGDEFLTPYSNDYNRWLQYQTYDITQLLAERSTISVTLGNGWYKERFGFNSAGKRGFYGDRWMLIAEIRIWYTDGRIQTIGTDESWTVSGSNILFSNIYDGEHRDDTLPETEKVPARLCGEPKGRLEERMSLPVQIHERMKPVALLHTSADEWVLDMGQNFAGIFRLHVAEPAGTQIRLQFGEVLQNGCFYRDNLRTAAAEYRYVSDGQEKDIIPSFTYYGYRYVKVEGISHVRMEDFEGLALYSQITRAGELETGHALVNKLVANTRWGLKSNFVDVPTDCPQRDERMGWTGDAQVFSPTASYLEESYRFYAKYLHDMAQEQKDFLGMVPDVIPSAGYATCSSVWGDAVCIIPWNLYLFYGDKTILEDQFESMRGWVDYICRIDGADGGWGKHFHYGDWLALDHPAGKVDMVLGGTEEAYIAYIYYAASAGIVAKAAGVLGKKEEEAKYSSLAERIRGRVIEEYFTPTGRCAIGTQTGLLLALKYGLSSDSEKIRKLLRKRFEDCGNKLQTGFVGTPQLCDILSENGMDDLAFHLLLNEEYPGWLHEIKLGATTIWERWNSINEDGSISSTGMNSLNHYAYGSIVEWLFRYVAGIAPVEACPGFRKARIQPRLNRMLGYVNAGYTSAAGKFEVHWKILDQYHVTVSVTIPFGAEAELVLPLGSRVKAPEVLQAGTYVFTYETDGPIWENLSVGTPLGILAQEPEVLRIMKSVIPSFDALPAFQYGKSLRDVLYSYAEKKVADPYLDEITNRLIAWEAARERKKCEEDLS